MSKTKIEWADRVWNPVTGCTKVSAGCKHCYAERMSKRLRGRCGYPEDNPFKVTLHAERLGEPLKWCKPSRVFVCSMGDLFHEAVPEDYLVDIWMVMRGESRQNFIILTKRPGRMAHFINRFKNITTNNPHIWLGVSVEDQATADERVPLLLQTPASKRFVSYEPALGPVDFTKTGGLWTDMNDNIVHNGAHIGGGLDWLIMGGETGPGARPMHPDWVRCVRDQCSEAGIPFFFKSWGEWVSYDQTTESQRMTRRPSSAGLAGDYSRDVGFWKKTGKKAAGSLIDGREWKEFPK